MALNQIVCVVVILPHLSPLVRIERWRGRSAVNAPPRHMMHGAKMGTSDAEIGPTITAVLERGPLEGRRIDVDVVEGRPPKTIDVPADDGSRCRYCLADWTQSGPSAIYTFLYLV